MSEEGEVVPEEMEVELPPQLEELLQDLKGDRKTLLKSKAYERPDQLRQFIAQVVIPRFSEMIEIFGTALYDTYQLSASNARQQQKMHRWAAKHLRTLGAEVSDNDLTQELAADRIDAFSQAFYALGSKLQEKLPEDKEMQEVWNRCAKEFDALLADLMGNQDFDEGDEDDEDEGEGDEEEDAEEKADAKVETPPGTEEPKE